MALETFLRLPEEKQQLIIREGLKEFSYKNYQDANTDEIIKACGISKGSLYHYFGNKKNFYLFLLSHSLAVFEGMNRDEYADAHTFYEVIFQSLDSKMSIYCSYPLETALLTIAAKEQCAEVAADKNKLMLSSMEHARKTYLNTLNIAVSHLTLKENLDRDAVLRALNLYIDALRNGYMLQYRDKPYAFLEDRELIKRQLKESLDLFLYGVVA